MILYQMPFESLCRKYNLCPRLPSLSYFFSNGIHFLAREPRSGAGTVPGCAEHPPLPQRGPQSTTCRLRAIYPHHEPAVNAKDKFLTFPAARAWTSFKPFNRHSQK